MSEEPPVVGPPAYLDSRNPLGWILIGTLVFLMVAGQLGSYLTRGPSSELHRAEIEEELQTAIGLESMPGSDANRKTMRDRLSVDAAGLRPTVAKDAKSAILYAAIRTELGQSVDPADLTALQTAKDDVSRAAYEIYSHPALDSKTASALASRVPDTNFLNKLVEAQAYQKANDQGPRQALAAQSGLVTKILANVLLIGLGVLGIALLFAYGVVRSKGEAKPKGLPLSDLTLADADRVALRSAQLFVTFLGVALAVGPIFLHLVRKEFVDLPIYLVIVAVVIALAYAPVGGKFFTFARLGITRRELGKNILWGLAGAVANVPILVLVESISLWVFRGLPAPEHPVTVELTDTHSPLVILQLVLIASVLAPFIEEIMFRGTLFPALTRVFRSPLWAGVVSSLIFAAIHPTGIPAWPGLAAIGGMSCFLSYQTKSLVPSIIMHAANNFGVLAMTLIALR